MVLHMQHTSAVLRVSRQRSTILVDVNISDSRPRMKKEWIEWLRSASQFGCHNQRRIQTCGRLPHRLFTVCISWSSVDGVDTKFGGTIEQTAFGEIEAAKACGMSKALIYRRIILPSTFRRALPAYGNEVIFMLHGSALAGVITIVDVTAEASSAGILALFFFTALISVNLGVLNLLPIPALDGGHIMFNLYEMFTGKSASEQTMMYMTIIGWAILISLMMLGLYNDINRLIGG